MIQKTLQDIAQGGDTDQNLMFAGDAAYTFKRDPFHSNGFVQRWHSRWSVSGLEIERRNALDGNDGAGR